jgi:putative SOS response-associated peptidase YedK
MSGRFFLDANAGADPGAVAAAFGVAPPALFPGRYNIAPGQPVAIVRMTHGRRELALVRWGFIPSWVKDPRKYGPFVNARGEGIAAKPAFRGGMQYRRCLVPASGWYHWQEDRDGRRRPWAIRPRDGGLLGLAGLWDPWLGADGSEIDGGLIITVAAGHDIAGIADRMPAIVRPEDHERWLDCDRVDAAAASALLAPAPEGTLEAVPVSDRVNRVENDDPGLLSPG